MEGFTSLIRLKHDEFLLHDQKGKQKEIKKKNSDFQTVQFLFFINRLPKIPLYPSQARKCHLDLALQDTFKRVLRIEALRLIAFDFSRPGRGKRHQTTTPSCLLSFITTASSRALNSHPHFLSCCLKSMKPKPLAPL